MVTFRISNALRPLGLARLHKNYYHSSLCRNEIYSKLSVKKREIRLAILKPAEDINETVHCEVKTISLDDKPEYEALSYVCGDPKDTKNIRVAGLEFPVYSNLRTALGRVRHKSTSRVIWIDAISIN